MWNGDDVRKRVPAGAGSEPKPTFDERRMAAWIGKSLVVQGRVISTEDLTIDGRVEGAIELGEHSLTIGVGAAVEADLIAQRIIICGAVTGNILANETVDLRATGSVDGDISTPRFVMAEGATIKGRVDASGSKAAAGSVLEKPAVQQDVSPR
jgi:cytoskeletal protein CcmA (bactofilin family)